MDINPIAIGDLRAEVSILAPGMHGHRMNLLVIPAIRMLSVPLELYGLPINMVPGWQSDPTGGSHTIIMLQSRRFPDET